MIGRSGGIMKRIVALLSAVLLVFSISFLISGCIGQPESGVKLSNKKYEIEKRSDSPYDNPSYDFVFSCKLKNTTKQRLAVVVKFTARYSGIFGSESSAFETVVLESKETKNVTFRRERTGDQVYTKSITITSVAEA